MARNKKRKKNSAKEKLENQPQAKESKKKSSSSKESLEAEIAPKLPDTQEAKIPAVSQAKVSVRISTCVAGMFLTFIAGLYLGSFLPGIMTDMAANKTHPEVQNQIINQAAPEQVLTHKESIPKENSSSSLRTSESSVAEQSSDPIRHLEKDILAHPDDAKIWTELGNAYFDNNSYQKAISAYEQSLRIEPGNPDVLTDLGIMYRETKNYEKALECFRKASEINPTHINALFNEGVVLSADLGRNAEAIDAWKRVLAIHPDATSPEGRKIADMVRQLQ